MACRAEVILRNLFVKRSPQWRGVAKELQPVSLNERLTSLIFGATRLGLMQAICRSCQDRGLLNFHLHKKGTIRPDQESSRLISNTEDVIVVSHGQSSRAMIPLPEQCSTFSVLILSLSRVAVQRSIDQPQHSHFHQYTIDNELCTKNSRHKGINPDNHAAEISQANSRHFASRGLSLSSLTVS